MMSKFVYDPDFITILDNLLWYNNYYFSDFFSHFDIHPMKLWEYIEIVIDKWPIAQSVCKQKKLIETTIRNYFDYNLDDYEYGFMFLTENLINKHKITKSEAVDILVKSKNYEALVELIKWDPHFSVMEERLEL
jgi:hypothetical protein